jgi:hypothetical protein
MEALPSIRPLRARLFLDGSIEGEVAVPGVELPVKLSIGRSVQRMFRSSIDGQEIDLTATDHTAVLVREALYKEIARLRRHRPGGG